MVGLVEATVAAFEATICLDVSRELERPIAEHSWNRELDASGGVAQRFEAAAKTLNIPLKLIRDDHAASRDFYQAGLVLVRPDQFVAWTASDAAPDATAILQRAVGAGP